MKSKFHRVNHVLHTHLHNGDVSAMLKRTLIAVAVSIWITCALTMLIAWGLR